MSRWPGLRVIAAAFLLPQLAGAADWPGYEKLTREQVVAALAKATNARHDRDAINTFLNMVTPCD